MGIFDIFKSGDKGKGGDGASGGNGTPAGGMEFNPEKAKRFFDRARAVFDTGQYEYAMSLYLQGLRFEPNNLDAVQKYFEAGDQFRAKGGTAPSKETLQSIAGSSPVHRYLAGLLGWSVNIRDGEAALKLTLATADLQLREIGRWIGQRTLTVCKGAAKPRKDWFVKLMRAFMAIECFDLAAQAGDLALMMDPTDSKLAADVRNLSAQATMSKGGYENTGQEGGFRQNIKDADKQRLAEEARRGVKSDDALQRALLAAKADYEANPADKPTIRNYIKTLGERGTPADELTAIEVAEAAFKSTQEFTFKRLAGDMRIKRGRRELRATRDAAQANPADAAAQQAFLAAEQKQLELEIAEYQAWAVAYPTDLKIKAELGKRYLLNKQYEEAVGQLQLAKDDARQRSEVMALLAQAFMSLGWLEESVTTCKQALEQHQDQNDTMGLELRYALVLALSRKAEAERDLPAAIEADKVASAIAIQQIGYKDIRARREALKALIAQLRQSGGAAGAPATA